MTNLKIDALSLNVFKYGYCPWRYPSNWFKNIRQFFTNLRLAWERATKGFCSYDTYDLDAYYKALFANSIAAFAEKNPSVPYGMTDEEWANILDKMVMNFTNAQMDVIESNPFAKEYYAMVERHRHCVENSDGTTTWTFDALEGEDLNLKDHFDYNLDRNQELRQSYQDEGMEMLKQYLSDLWW